MPTLTEAAEVSRSFIKWGAICLLALMIGRAVIGGAINWWKTTHPTQAPPTMGFGALPALQFPQKEQPSLTFELQTITGKLPEVGEQADVLLMPAQRPNLLAMDRSTKAVSSVGFKTQPEKISDQSYRWRVTSPLPSELTMSIYDGRFVWITDWTTNPNFLNEKQLPDDDVAITMAKSLVSQMGEQAADLTTEAATTTYLKGLGGTYQPAASYSEADFIQVDLFRKQYRDAYSFVTSTPAQGIVRVIISGNPRAGRIVRVLYNYFPVDYTAVETYPLKPVDQAWQELQNGKGFIAQVDKGTTTAIIRRVELAYYDSYEPLRYIQPVFVFTGDNNFVGYVPAVGTPKRK